MARRRKHKTKHHNVKQSVKQTVIVQVGESKSKRRGKRRTKGGGRGGEQAPQMMPIQAPVVAYQTGYGSFPMIQGAPIKEPFTYKPPAEIGKSVMEDVGVGTEGFVSILDRPTKKETLGELISPVPPEFFRASVPSDPAKGIYIPALSYKPEPRQNETERSEAYKMLREDVASTGLAQIDMPLEPFPVLTERAFADVPVKKFDEETSSVVSGITQSEIPTEPLYSQEKVLKPPRRNSWNDLLNRYKKVTGETFIRPVGRRKGQIRPNIREFQREVERLEAGK